MTPTERIARLQAALDAATKGEWYRTGPLSEEESCRAGGVAAGLVAVADEPELPEDEQVDLIDNLDVRDLDFIALAHNELPWLLEQARIVEAARAYEQHRWDMHNGKLTGEHELNIQEQADLHRKLRDMLGMNAAAMEGRT